MNSRNVLLAKSLTYSGTLPFILCVISLLMNFPFMEASFLVRAYASVIISFLCGIHWAIYLFFSDKCPKNLFISSNVVAAIAWLSLITPPYIIFLMLQPICFLYMLFLDFQLCKALILPNWFYNLRRNATIIVILSLSTIIILL